jgi:hypothetical protein
MLGDQHDSIGLSKFFKKIDEEPGPIKGNKDNHP